VSAHAAQQRRVWQSRVASMGLKEQVEFNPGGQARCKHGEETWRVGKHRTRNMDLVIIIFMHQEQGAV
jgi:hypothetical protein